LPTYYAHVTKKGPVKYGRRRKAIWVFAAQDQYMPIGEASCQSRDENGLAVWTLLIGKNDIPGKWIIVDGEFRLTTRAV
jgi:hypothetical protein